MAVDFFLKLDSIDGESAADGHTNEISLLSFSWGGSQVSSVAGTGGSGAGKVSLENLHAMKYYDKASPSLFKALISGTHIKTGVLSACKSGVTGGKPFLKVSFEELFVTNLSISGSSETPAESVSFSYNKIKVEYSTQDEKGILTAVAAVSYDLKANKVS
ncbi:Hcp family type VI secretion system effector [Terracidiphilus gabretensis]|jgi:type VI secretion system secreted protein Hcp|uniref:Hcp family type VI secretion system effector n=1 Tax=Terracidiphilus gabretensis TaxID=1577687 RepID=UPI00071BC599|nr:type VI secretion system tube protein Hcp [Terracidiphilus gabretensis]